MTSKISFFRIRKENMKHHLAILLLTIFCFLMHGLAFVIRIQNLTDGSDWKYKEVAEKVAAWAEPGYLQAFGIIVFAVILAMSGFRYLHSRTKTDFYHSLPIKRDSIFAVVTLNSLLIFAIPFLVACVAETAIAGVTGFLTVTFVKNVFASVLCYFLVFMISFLTAALAMIMTGNLSVGLLGFSVFAGYAPVLIKNIFPCLADVFFDTYVSATPGNDILDYLSPVSLSCRLTQADSGWSLKAHGGILAVVLVEIIVMLILCQKLFKIRPSEAAGRAMAFPKTKSVIRILLVIPAALYTGIFFYSMTMMEHKIWLVIGVIIGVVLFHGLIESIYQFDIRGFLSCKKQLGVCLAVCFLIVGIFYTDTFGYDKYVPKTEKTKAVLIEPQFFSDRKDSFWGDEQEGITGQEMEDVLELLRKKAEQKDNSEEFYQENVTVTYTLNSGRKVKRTYLCSREEELKLMEQIFSSREYKKNLYSLYTADWDKITDITWDNQMDFVTLKLTPEEKEEFLNTYLLELDTLSFNDMTTIAATSEFCITREAGRVDDYYYVYPSFVKNIAFLKSKGCSADETMKDRNVISLELDSYGDDGVENTWMVTDPDLIAEVKDKLEISGFCGNVYNMYRTTTINDVDITANVLSKYGSQAVSVTTDKETLEKLLEK